MIFTLFKIPARQAVTGFTVLLYLTFFSANSSMSEECLKFQYTNSSKPLREIADNFKIALEMSGICVKLVDVPIKRQADALRSKEMDGIVLRIPAFAKVVGKAGTMIEEELAVGRGLLISYDKTLHSTGDLIGRSVAIHLGTVWQAQVIKPGTVIIKTPAPANQIYMLKQLFVDAILMDSLSVNKYQKELTDALKTEILDLSGYAWIRSDLQHLIPRIMRAIQIYKNKGSTFMSLPTTAVK